MAKKAKQNKTTAPVKSEAKVSNQEVKAESIDLSKIETPVVANLNNQLLLDTIQAMVIERAKENPKHPHVGVNEIAERISSDHANLTVDGKDVRRKLQKIRKKAPGYIRASAGTVTLAPDNSQNPYKQPMVIQWADMNNRQKGIEYVVALEPEPQG